MDANDGQTEKTATSDHQANKKTKLTTSAKHGCSMIQQTENRTCQIIRQPNIYIIQGAKNRDA